MPVSGRPTKAALLKTTHGSSGPEAKPLQKTRKAAGAGSLSLTRPVGTEVRVARSQTMTVMAAARKMEREITSVPHLRSGLFSLASLLTSPFRAPEGDFAADELRWWKERTYVPLGSSTTTGSSSPSAA